jgi:hypothetical protein
MGVASKAYEVGAAMIVVTPATGAVTCLRTLGRRRPA